MWSFHGSQNMKKAHGTRRLFRQQRRDHMCQKGRESYFHASCKFILSSLLLFGAICRLSLPLSRHCLPPQARLLPKAGRRNDALLCLLYGLLVNQPLKLALLIARSSFGTSLCTLQCTARHTKWNRRLNLITNISSHMTHLSLNTYDIFKKCLTLQLLSFYSRWFSTWL